MKLTPGRTVLSAAVGAFLASGALCSAVKRFLPNFLNLPSNWQGVRTRALVLAGVQMRE